VLTVDCLCSCRTVGCKQNCCAPQACGRAARGTGSSDERDSSFGQGLGVVELLCWMLNPLSALHRMLVRRHQHQLQGIWPSLVEPAVNGMVADVNIDGIPVRRIRAKYASSWETGPVSVNNARSQPLRMLRSMVFHEHSSLLPVSIHYHKS